MCMKKDMEDVKLPDGKLAEVQGGTPGAYDIAGVVIHCKHPGCFWTAHCSVSVVPAAKSAHRNATGHDNFEVTIVEGDY